MALVLEVDHAIHVQQTSFGPWGGHPDTPRYAHTVQVHHWRCEFLGGGVTEAAPLLILLSVMVGESRLVCVFSFLKTSKNNLVGLLSKILEAIISYHFHVSRAGYKLAPDIWDQPLF